MSEPLTPEKIKEVNAENLKYFALTGSLLVFLFVIIKFAIKKIKKSDDNFSVNHPNNVIKN